jgi:hypothetical protein
MRGWVCRPGLRTRSLDGSHTYGPVFANPYDTSRVYVLTATGVRYSIHGGLEFDPEPTLTSLISGNGKYPIGTDVAEGKGNNVRMATTRAVVLGPLADMDFRRDDPRMAVAVSPFTGVFFRDKNGKWHSGVFSAINNCALVERFPSTGIPGIGSQDA